jgi:hypothetical protein
MHSAGQSSTDQTIHDGFVVTVGFCYFIVILGQRRNTHKTCQSPEHLFFVKQLLIAISTTGQLLKEISETGQFIGNYN